MEPVIYHTSERELHLFDDCVAVAWNTRKEKRTIKGEDGLTYTAEAPVREGQPYIDFVTVSELDDGTCYEDEDSPAEGGMSAEYAEDIATALMAAIAYLRALNTADQEVL